MDKLPHFDQQQLEYFRDTDFLITKRKIIDQVQYLLAATEQTLVKWVEENKPQEIPEKGQVIAGKISRGENYKGLPYLVLDYPRLFKKNNVFSFRTMCWWGNFFSCTLHIQGTSLQHYRPVLEQSLTSTPTLNDTFLCVNNTPWEYHYEADNYQLLNNLTDSQIRKILQQDFIKLSRKTALEDYQKLPLFAKSCFIDFLKLLN